MSPETTRLLLTTTARLLELAREHLVALGMGGGPATSVMVDKLHQFEEELAELRRESEGT